MNDNLKKWMMENLPGVSFTEIPRMDDELHAVGEDALKELYARAVALFQPDMTAEECVDGIATTRAIEREFARRGKLDLLIALQKELELR